MNYFDFPELFIVQVSMVVVSLIWYLRRKDEVPLLIAVLLIYVSSYRYLAVQWGLSTWVGVFGLYGLSPITNDAALHALEMIIFGEIVLLLSYMYFASKNKQKSVIYVESFSFSSKTINKVLFFGGMLIPLVFVTKGKLILALAGGASLAYGVSGYLYLFPLAITGLSVLLIWFWKMNIFYTKAQKVMAAFIIMVGMFAVFDPSSRFNFIGFLVASGSILLYGKSVSKQFITACLLISIILGLFAFAGTLRGSSNQGSSFDRLSKAEDANMLDGMAIVQQISPARLDYLYGMGHFEILLRPIPRSLWPSKPVGGYANKLGLVDSRYGGTIGISPTLFGSFYIEGGSIAVFLFSFLYGLCIAKVFKFALAFEASVYPMVKGIMLASLILLLRGGDLPGNFAFIGMAFWPCFLFLWINRKTRKRNVQVSI